MICTTVSVGHLFVFAACVGAADLRNAAAAAPGHGLQGVVRHDTPVAQQPVPDI